MTTDLDNNNAQEVTQTQEPTGGGVKEALGLKDAPGDLSERKEERVANAVKRAIHKDLKDNKGHTAHLFAQGEGKDRLSTRQERKIIENAVDVAFDNLIKNHKFNSEPELRAALQKELQNLEVHYDYKDKEKVDGKRTKVEKSDTFTVNVDDLRDNKSGAHRDDLRDKKNEKLHFEQADESPLQRKGVKLLLTVAEAGLTVVNPVLGIASIVAAKTARKASDLGGENWAGHLDEKTGKVVPNEDQDLGKTHLAVEGFEKADRKILDSLQEEYKKLQKKQDKGQDTEKESTGEQLIKKAKGLVK